MELKIEQLEQKITKVDFIPLISISSIDFVTGDKRWRERLRNVTLKIGFINFEKESKLELFHYSKSIPLSSYTSLEHNSPVIKFTPNYFIQISSHYKNYSQEVDDSYWEIRFEIENLDEIKEGEYFLITYMDRNHIIKRVNDWKHRVENLFQEILNAQELSTKYHVEKGREVIMNESMMGNYKVAQISLGTIDVYSTDRTKLILSIKPFGLWILGANGRIDVLTKKQKYVLVDNSEQFSKSEWWLHNLKDKSHKSPFSIKLLQEILDYASN